jgi:hypothetical protein
VKEQLKQQYIEKLIIAMQNDVDPDCKGTAQWALDQIKLSIATQV